MNPGEEFVQNFLAHYADEYYDPQKAHEYYLQNRELKGRQSTSGLTVKYTTRSKKGKAVEKVDQAASDRKKQAWTYAKKQIDAAQKSDVASAGEARKAAVKQAQEAASARRDQISAQLSDYLKTLTQQHAGEQSQLSKQGQADLDKFAADQQAKSKKISEDAANQIASLPEIPKGVSDSLRAQLLAGRAAAIDRIRQTASDSLTQVVADTKSGSASIAAGTVATRDAASASLAAQQQKGRDDATSSRQVVSTDLKATVEKARIDYEARKETLKSQYDATAQKEYDAIKARV